MAMFKHKANLTVAIFLTICLFEAKAQTADTTPDATTLNGIRAGTNEVLATGKQFEVEPDLAALLGLADSNGKWSVRGIGKRKHSDHSISTFAVSIDSKKDLYFVFKPSNEVLLGSLAKR